MQLYAAKKRSSLLLRLLCTALFATLCMAGGLFLLVVVWVRLMRYPRIRGRLIHWNKQTLNPITLKRAGHQASIYASVKHVGRHSGRTYMTPVVAKPLGDGFVIPLPYGAGVDWCRNVQAAGICTLLIADQEYAVERPELLTLPETGKAFPLVSHWLYTAGGLKQYLWLHQQREGAEGVTTPKAKALATSTPSLQ